MEVPLVLTPRNYSSVRRLPIRRPLHGHLTFSLVVIVGAEGTLGIITEVTIRLAPRLPTNVAIAQFPDVRAATEAVRDVRSYVPSLPAVQRS